MCKSEHTLQYNEPARSFDRALPIGNGRLGGMVYGQQAEERLLLNESGMWSGSVQDADRPGAADHLPEIRALLAAGRNKEAEELFLRHFTCEGEGTARGHGAAAAYGCYQMLGWLTLNYFQTLSFASGGYDHLEGYSRSLDLRRAVACVRFPGNGIEYRREYFASAPDNAIVIRLTASKPGSVNVGIGLDRPERREVAIHGNDTLLMQGALDDGCGGEGVRYTCAVKAVAKGGEVVAECGRLYVKHADEALLLVTAATSFSGFPGARGIEDVRAKALEEAQSAAQKSWEALLARHVEDYTGYYSRSELCFEKPALPLEGDLADRVRRSELGELDPGLIELYYHYTRYLLISCSRPGGMPANLQGIWAEEIQTPWNGDWHLNAQQMIYWSAERANLSENHLPFLELTKSLAQPGAKTAKAYYDAAGWVVHTCTNAWLFTSPCEDASWGSTLGSGAWQAHHLWEHYLYTGDKDYLRAVYPAMKGAAEFYLDVLVEEPEHGWLVTSPSSSPENSFYTQEGDVCALCQGPAYDTELLRSLFGYCIEAMDILGCDEAFNRRLRDTLARMAPIQIASDGRIMEWLEEYGEPLPYHRHLSHLWGAFPGMLISREATPELAAAAEKSLLGRGETTAGWAIAYRMCLAARLRNTALVEEYLHNALRFATAYNLFNLAYHCDETLEIPLAPDIERGRYPFQIDGNMGVATGIMLMLLDDRLEQTEDGERTVLTLLPALPKKLSAGSVKGLCAMGGFVVDLSWRGGKPVSATVQAKNPGTCVLETAGKRTALSFTAPGTQTVAF